jgi:hypothetical protein
MRPPGCVVVVGLVVEVVGPDVVVGPVVVERISTVASVSGVSTVV